MPFLSISVIAAADSVVNPPGGLVSNDLRDGGGDHSAASGLLPPLPYSIAAQFS